MDFKEYLQSKGLDVATAETIINGMAEQKLYITDEENAGTRLKKAKEKNKQYEEDLNNANTLIEQLKQNNVSA